ncbi:MAG: hypothetical protein NVS9B2_08460 [Steroidobacteraceae bacterium]
MALASMSWAVSAPGAAQFNLRRGRDLHGFKVRGVGGQAEVSLVTVKSFTLAGIPLHNIDFLVGGSEIGGGSIGVLGQNFLEKWDVEYDLAQGLVRLFKVEDCPQTLLAYWSSGQAVSMMDISHTTFSRPHTTGTAYINGAKITVLFDTGAATSVLSLKAAARAGVKPGIAGVLDAGYSRGIGRNSVRTFIAPFATFKIGDGEEIKNTQLRIADIDLEEGDMLLGSDFFLSHHLFVANSQHRLYLTYNGGPVFNLSRPAPADAAAASPDAPNGDKRDEPADAAAFARRGAAFTGRRDFEHAVADLTRACELDPAEPEYLYRRGIAYREDRQPVPAMTDFDHALDINPHFLPARLTRAELRLENSDISGAIDDLDAADRIAAKQADARITLAQLYGKAGQPAAAVAQLDSWIAAHPDDSKMAQALTGRCWQRAYQGQDLAKALTDCNAALRLSAKSGPDAAAILGGRALVRLRMGQYDKAIADYDDSLRLAPGKAGILYGRGVAKLRSKKSAAAEADFEEAVKLSPHVADEFRQRGITP